MMAVKCSPDRSSNRWSSLTVYSTLYCVVEANCVRGKGASANQWLIVSHWRRLRVRVILHQYRVTSVIVPFVSNRVVLDYLGEYRVCGKSPPSQRYCCVAIELQCFAVLLRGKWPKFLCYRKHAPAV